MSPFPLHRTKTKTQFNPKHPATPNFITWDGMGWDGGVGGGGGAWREDYINAHFSPSQNNKQTKTQGNLTPNTQPPQTSSHGMGYYGMVGGGGGRRQSHSRTLLPFIQQQQKTQGNSTPNTQPLQTFITQDRRGWGNRQAIGLSHTVDHRGQIS